MSWLRDRVMATLKGEPPGAGNLKVAVESGLESLLREEAAAAAERAELVVAGQRRRTRPARGCRRRPVAIFARVRSEGGAGHSRLAGRCLDLVADEGMSKRSKARFYALGVNGVGVALMIVVFAHTGGLVGAEIGVAGGTAVLAQRVLEASLGIRRFGDWPRRPRMILMVGLRAGRRAGALHMILNGLGVEADQSTRVRQAARRWSPPAPMVCPQCGGGRRCRPVSGAGNRCADREPDPIQRSYR